MTTDLIECPECHASGMVPVARGGDRRTCPECLGAGFLAPPMGKTWDGRTGEKCPEPNCDGVKDHDGSHFAWTVE